MEGMTTQGFARGRSIVRMLGWILALAVSLAVSLPAQEQKPPEESNPIEEQEAAIRPTDWAPQLLFEILSSSNPQASDALYRAAFAAGPEIVSQLTEALKDDRTAEFAAQSLAYIGGRDALEILWKQVNDPRDLNLRRFYYGALAEIDAPEANQTLLEVIKRSEEEPDRTVTETAIIALTVRADPALAKTLREARDKLTDVVIRLDLENAADVIEARARLLATPEGQKLGGSVEDAVRKYFLPALHPPPAPPGSAHAIAPKITVRVEHLTLSPDQNRALARVIFEDPSAEAHYDIVLQKRSGNWTLASVWLGPEVEKPAPLEPPAPTKR
jgi:HEAT repeats